ncbi:MAG: TonB-dependent receptor domain-containing protein [Parashewanella sp.]
MLKNSFIAKSVKFALIGGAATAALSTPVFAAEEKKDGEKVERIAVTGSRIARAELTQATPIVSIGKDELASFGNTDIASVLSELPAIAATDTLIGNNNSNESAGVSSANLRALGAARTLTLVNGKRHVAGEPGSAQVDLSTIPASLVERIDIITGGASAIYGSDAVTGVVNVILRKNFEGFEFDAKLGDSLEGVGTKNHSFTLLTGTEIGDGKGNISVYANHQRTKEVLKTSVRQFDNWGTIKNPESKTENDGIPDRLRVRNIYSELISNTGVINGWTGSPAVGRWTFDEAGNPVKQTERAGVNSFAFGYFPNGCKHCFSPENYENYIPEVNKSTVGGFVNYELHEAARFYSDFKYTTSKIEQQFQPSFRFGNVSINVDDNAFLDAGLRKRLQDAGQKTAQFAKFFDELGNRSANNQRDLFRYLAGFEGDFELSETPFSYDLYYSYGETRNERKTLNSLIPANFLAALDSVIDPKTGKAACRSQVKSKQGEGYKDPAAVNGNECVAYNPFGLGNMSEAARKFVSADVTRKDKITQEYMGISVTTDTSEFFELPGGPVDIAFGYEYREETSATTTDEFTQRGLTANAATPDKYGKYDVKEYFVEVNLPILDGVFLAEKLTVDAAFRSGDYSHAGKTDAWKLGVFYSPIADLSLRGTIGEAVRAPNVEEAFSPISPGFARITDPCDADNIDENPNRKANCAALGIPSGFEANDNVTVDTLSGGNPNLKPENSESKTYGIVWQPSFVEDFSINLDYYDIQIEDAILSVAASRVVDNCVDSEGGPDAEYCSQVTRDPVTKNVTLVKSGYLNASAFNTKGIEFETNYKMDLGSGELGLKLSGNKLLELERFEFQNIPDKVNDEKGEVGDPSLQLRFSAKYRLDDLALTWNTRFIDRSATFDVSKNEGGSPEDVSPAYVGSMVTHSLSGSYVLTDNLAIRAGVRNLFDKLPPGYTENAIYDLVGRRYFVGLTFKM